MNEKEKKRQSASTRLLFAILLAAAGALLIGASRLGDSMATRQAEQARARDLWHDTVRNLVPARSGSDGPGDRELRKLAGSHPEYLLQALHQDPRPETQH